MTAGEDRALRLWSAESKQAIATLHTITTGQTKAVAMSADATIGLTGHLVDPDRPESCAQLLNVWDLDKVKLRASLAQLAGVTDVDLTPDGRFAACGDVDGAIGVWDVTTAQRVCEVREIGSQIDRLKLTADGKYVTFLASSQLGVIDVAAGECVRTFRTSPSDTPAVAISPDGGVAISGGGLLDAHLLIWDLSTVSADLVSEGHRRSVHHILHEPAWNKLVSFGDDGKLCEWDRQTGQGPGRNLIEQRLKQVKVPSIDQRNSYRCALQRTCGVRPAEAAADDDDMM